MADQTNDLQQIYSLNMKYRLTSCLLSIGIGVLVGGIAMVAISNTVDTDVFSVWGYVLLPLGIILVVIGFVTCCKVRRKMVVALENPQTRAAVAAMNPRLAMRMQNMGQFQQPANYAPPQGSYYPPQGQQPAQYAPPQGSYYPPQGQQPAQYGPPPGSYYQPQGSPYEARPLMAQPHHQEQPSYPPPQGPVVPTAPGQGEAPPPSYNMVTKHYR